MRQPARSNVQQFLALADRAQTILESDADWETKYDLIFSADISEAVLDTGITIAWVDPDTTYEEDVRTFVRALTERAQQLRLAGVTTEPDAPDSTSADAP